MLSRSTFGCSSIGFASSSASSARVKTRYRGLAKNRAQLFTLFALGNLFLVRRRLMA
jgi:IS5 family transposase